MHIEYVEPNDSQSIKFQDSKYQFDTLNCTLEELTILELVARNSVIKQQALVEVTGKSIATANRLMKSLQIKTIYGVKAVDATANGRLS